MKPNPMSFTDGFNFGCGFWVAGFIFFVVALPLGTFFLLVFAGAIGVALGS